MRVPSGRQRFGGARILLVVGTGLLHQTRQIGLTQCWNRV